MTDVVIVEGKEYPSGKDAANCLGVSYTTLLTRLKSQSDRWSAWRVKPLEVDVTVNGKFYSDIDKAIVALCILKLNIELSEKKPPKNNKSKYKGKTYYPRKTKQS